MNRVDIGGMPSRPALCVDCRAVVDAATGCELDASHALFELSATGDRRALLDAVWTPATRDAEREAYVRGLKRKARDAFLATTAITVLLMLVDSALFGPYIPMLTYFLLVAYFALRMPAVVQRLGELAGPSRCPRGSTWRCPRPSAARVGRISLDPGSPQVAVVAVELRLANGEVTLRHGWCIDHRIELDDGSLVRVAAGRVRVEAPADRWRPLAREEGRRLAAIADGGRPTGRPDDAPDLFPFDVAVTTALRHGDRIALVRCGSGAGGLPPPGAPADAEPVRVWLPAAK